MDDQVIFSWVLTGVLLLAVLVLAMWNRRLGERVADRNRLAAAKGLELIFNIDLRLDFSLVGDPLRLSQIFVNYLTNAVKFTEQGEIELIVELREETDSDVLLYCAVRDTGIGLSEMQRARL